MSVRAIPLAVPSPEEIGIPPVLASLCDLKQGFVLVTGPTGSGKSTTLASMIEHINDRRPVHILTIEDPIEYTHKHRVAAIDQREVGVDTQSFARALRSALREDPDVILVGEMRDPETIQFALTLAETGHLVFATLHTNDAAQSLDRISDVFPPERQTQIRVQLAASLAAVVSQRLLPRVGGGLVAAFELLVANDAVRNLIREGRTHQLRNVIRSGAARRHDHARVGAQRARRRRARVVRGRGRAIDAAQGHRAPGAQARDPAGELTDHTRVTSRSRRRRTLAEGAGDFCGEPAEQETFYDDQPFARAEAVPPPPEQPTGRREHRPLADPVGPGDVSGVRSGARARRPRRRTQLHGRSELVVPRPLLEL